MMCGRMMTEIDDDGAWLGLTICFTSGVGRHRVGILGSSALFVMILGLLSAFVLYFLLPCFLIFFCGRVFLLRLFSPQAQRRSVPAGFTFFFHPYLLYLFPASLLCVWLLCFCFMFSLLGWSFGDDEVYVKSCFSPRHTGEQKWDAPG